jgi:two-component system cell cycle response regulator
VLVDIDGLRAVNDQWGQIAGDLVINEVAERLHAQIRASDSAAHLGGDEFAVILPDTAVAQALPLAARILQAVRAQPVDVGGEHDRPVTVSVGLAAMRPGAEIDRKAAADHLLASASAALHKAKVGGRDRYVVATDV